MKIFSHLSRTSRRAFSLIELMVSITVLSMLLVIVFQMLEQMQRTWKRTRQTVSEFKDARNGFDEMNRRIGQATLNSYFGYKWESKTLNGIPTRYGRQITPESELHFVCGPTKTLLGEEGPSEVGSRPGHAVFFQAPFGFCVNRDADNAKRLQYEQLNSLLNAWGYYVEFNTDEFDRPRFLNDLRNAPAPRLRYRLMEFRQPTEFLQVYKLNLRDSKSKVQSDPYYKWFSEGLFAVNSRFNTQKEAPASNEEFFRTTRPLAENIIAMFILPREADVEGTGKKPEDLAPNYLYDSRQWQWSGSTQAAILRTKHQLPPIMDITFVAVDEASFANYLDRSSIKAVSDEQKLVEKDAFTKASDFTEDMNSFEEKLTSLKLDYRIFSTTIRLRESKWTDS